MMRKKHDCKEFLATTTKELRNKLSNVRTFLGREMN
jgi:hypothetical protein